MKTLNYFALGVFCICLIVACDVSQTENELLEEPSLENLSLENSSKHRGIKHWHNRKVILFEAEFFTSNPGVGIVPDPDCSPPTLLETQTGEGHAKGLGDFTIHFNFCIDPTDLLDDGQLTEAEGDSATEAAPYYNGVSTIRFSNGDELYGKINGAVLPTDEAGFDAEFMDPMVFTGGTGRFEEVKGGGLTNSFVTLGVGTEHEFSGVIVLPKHSW